MVRLIALLLCLAGAARAESPMTGAEFDSYTQGKTLAFGLPSNPDFGIEQYLPDRQVIWSPATGDCVNGIWYEKDRNICFLYENDPEPKCWAVYRTPKGIRAEFMNDPGTTVLFEARKADPALMCPGPDLLS